MCCLGTCALLYSCVLSSFKSSQLVKVIFYVFRRIILGDFEVGFSWVYRSLLCTLPRYVQVQKKGPS